MSLRRILFPALLLAGAAARAQETPVRETPAQRDARMAWWRDARFGMFIHWGAYAVPAGTHRGERVWGTGEWIMSVGRIPVSEYEGFVRAFDPVRFDAEAWVRVAKDAGMRYIIITSKHHDGFALFDSQVSRYDVVDATPWRRDPMRALAQAARRAGLRFGVYYSIMDWHHPDSHAPNAPTYDSRTWRNPNFDRYVETYMKPQLRELLTRYPEIDVLWFDGEWIADWSDAKGRALYDELRRIRPSLLINNRIGHSREGMAGMSARRDSPGDFGTPEQEVPPGGLPGVDWETCMTMNDTWGFKAYDDNWKDPRSLVRTLIDVAAKGGNLLLNVGPTAEGVIPAPSVSRLREMGDWLRANGEAIYGTRASPYGMPAWGRYTARPQTGTVYAHVFDWPRDRKLPLTGVTEAPRRAYLLGDRTPLPVTRTDAGVVVELPRVAPSAIASVLVLEPR